MRVTPENLRIWFKYYVAASVGAVFVALLPAMGLPTGLVLSLVGVLSLLVLGIGLYLTWYGLSKITAMHDTLLNIEARLAERD